MKKLDFKFTDRELGIIVKLLRGLLCILEKLLNNKKVKSSLDIEELYDKEITTGASK